MSSPLVSLGRYSVSHHFSQCNRHQTISALVAFVGFLGMPRYSRMPSNRFANYVIDGLKRRRVSTAIVAGFDADTKTVELNPATVIKVATKHVMWRSLEL